MSFWGSIVKLFTPSKEKPKEKKEEKKPSTELPPKVDVKPAPVPEVKPEVPAVEEGYELVDLNKELLKEAAKWVGVREKGSNKGKEVEMFQKAVDGKAQGEAWCMAFMQYCVKTIEKKYKIESLIVHSEGCTDTWDRSPKSIKFNNPKDGSIIIWNYKGSWKGHTGIVRSFNEDRVFTIEGNTGKGEGIVREGDGVYERNRCRWGEGNMQVKGYILAFPEGLTKVKKV